MQIFQDFPLFRFNTFQVDVQCRRFIRFDAPDELSQWLKQNPARDVFVLGGGSNVLFTGDYEGTILHPAFKGKKIVSETGPNVRVRFSSGEEWDSCVEWAITQGLGGIENLSLIPGCAGAAPVQNIGAYGVEISERVECVDGIWLETGQPFRMTRSGCDFGYRYSIFKGPLSNKVVITSVVLRLSRKPDFHLEYGTLKDAVAKLGQPGLANIRRAVIEIRRAKLPDPEKTGNAGSFFKNPIVSRAFYKDLQKKWPDMPGHPSHVDEKVKIPAGWLIEQSGWKGKQLGRAGVHPYQALVLVNLGGAEGAEIAFLAEKIKKDVYEKFAIELVPEVNIL
ncbi:MAG: UDP-N-acetylmuramate dehydrogenase [Marinilabiliaceae bacterium]